MRRALPMLLVMLGLAILPARAQADAAFREAGELLDSWCDEKQVPLAEVYYVDSVGTTVSLWHGDPGLADNDVALWPVGSITKTFTAVLALELQEAGQLDLDAPLSNYIPEIDEMFTEAKLADVSLRTLMHHRSGLPYQMGDPQDYALLLPLARWLVGDGVQLSHSLLLSTVRHGELEFAPGSAYRYSNANFWLAALAMERATGRGYEELLQEYVLDEIGLSQTAMAGLPENCQRMPAHLLLDGELQNITDWDMPGLARSAGGLHCSTADLTRFSAALSSWQFLDEQQLAGLYDFMETGGTANGEPYAYGLGISKRFDGSRWMYGHNGITPGNRALWRFDPETGETLIIFSSLGNQGLNGIADELTAVLRGE